MDEDCDFPTAVLLPEPEQSSSVLLLWTLIFMLFTERSLMQYAYMPSNNTIRN